MPALGPAVPLHAILQHFSVVDVAPTVHEAPGPLTPPIAQTGALVGVAVGLLVGALEGDEVGLLVGAFEGLLVGGLGSPWTHASLICPP